MPLFEYRAYDLRGKVLSGLLDAPSRGSAYEQLKKRGVYPYRLVEDRGGIRRGTLFARRGDLSFVLTQLATLLKAGIPLTQALDSIFQAVEAEVIRRSIARLKSRIQEGESLGRALAEDRLFPSLLVRMVEAGESVGAVEGALERFADFSEREEEFLRRILGAIVYPSVVLVTSVGLIFFILTYVAPTLVGIFESFKKAMPAPTVVLLFLGTFLRRFYWLLAIILAALVFIWARFVPRRLKDGLKLRAPFIGRVYTYLLMSRWARTLALLHGGGVSITRALASTREVMENLMLQEYLKRVEERVEKGERLGAALGQVPFIPPLLSEMAETGEKSGELEKMMDVVATFYEKESERKLSLFFQLLEPALILVLGFIVGFVVISVLLPIFEINRIIK